MIAVQGYPPAAWRLPRLRQRWVIRVYRAVLGKKLFAKVGRVLHATGFALRGCTIVDAMLISVPSSTNNASKACDPEMHQLHKGQHWYFDTKLDIGVESQSELVHSAVVTAANVHHKNLLPGLLHRNEHRVYRRWSSERSPPIAIARSGFSNAPPQCQVAGSQRLDLRPLILASASLMPKLAPDWHRQKTKGIQRHR